MYINYRRCCHAAYNGERGVFKPCVSHPSEHLCVSVAAEKRQDSCNFPRNFVSEVMHVPVSAFTDADLIKYQDSRFDQSFDQETGYHTRSMIVVPLKL